MSHNGWDIPNQSETFSCLNCGIVFQGNRYGRKPKYCSRECKYSYEAKKYREEHPKHVELVCKYCSKSFIGENYQTKYCSSKCKNESNKETRPVYEKICPQCGDVFITRDKKQISCSRACGTIMGNEKLKKYYVCNHCGKRFSKPNGYRMKYCSNACVYEAKRIPEEVLKERLLQKQITKSCKWCNKEFTTSFPNKIYCSEECGYAGNLKDKRTEYEDEFVPKNFICKECGSKVITEYGKRFSSFCSFECQQKFFKRNHKSKRKEQMRLAYREPVSFKKIFKRDKGTCGICGLTVLNDKSPTNLWGATIDHILPLSQGGTHEASNCQLAHRICNSMKHDVTDEYTIDWRRKNIEDQGRWTKYLVEYEEQLISNTI